MISLEGRLAVVTGASRGIGLAVAEQLAAAGCIVVRMARSLTDGAPGRFRDIRCDLAQVSEIVRAATMVLGEWGTPSIVVQNAGTFLLRPFESTEPADLDRQLALNVRTPFVIAQSFLPAMRAAASGIHITIGSILDHMAYPDNSAYAASKYAVRGLHESLAAEYHGSGLRFSLVSPGSTDTPIWDPIDPDARPGLPRRSQMLRADDVADAVFFVATRPAHANVDWLRLSPNVAR